MNHIQVTYLMLLKNLILLLFLIQSVPTYAAQFRLLIGPKIETASSTESSISNTNPFSLIFEYDSRVYKKYFMSFGTSGEFDINNMSSSGFSLYGSIRYYFKGDPSLISSTGKDIKVYFVEPVSYFVGLGFFQKNISFDSGALNVRDIKENVGGLVFSGGGNYSLSNKYFLSGYLQYLLGGVGAEIDYNSIEGYLGLGLRL